MSAAVDVVVVAFRSRRHLSACVAPLVDDPRLNVVVVDNACPEGSGLEADQLGATVLRNGRNVGFGAACNQAAAVGRAPAILLLNPDAVIDADSVVALATRLDDDPGLGAVGPRLLRADGSTERSIGRAPRAGATLAEALYVTGWSTRSGPRSSPPTATTGRPTPSGWSERACASAARPSTSWAASTRASSSTARTSISA